MFNRHSGGRCGETAMEDGISQELLVSQGKFCVQLSVSFFVLHKHIGKDSRTQDFVYPYVGLKSEFPRSISSLHG